LPRSIKKQQIPRGNDRKKSKNNGKCRSRSLGALRMTTFVRVKEMQEQRRRRFIPSASAKPVGDFLVDSD
jgi:hypothetical protein